MAAFLKVGIEFESVLNQGLLRIAAGLPNGHPGFRYIYHEITEEAQHSMMFQELINRSGLDIPASSGQVHEILQNIVEVADDTSALFFLSVLSGEETFDYLQRRTLADRSIHPLLRRIYQIHITEEARHLSFARGFLRGTVPKLQNRDIRLVRYRTPAILDWTTHQIFGPEQLLTQLADEAEIPDDVWNAIVHGREATDIRRRSAARVIDLCDQLDLVDPRLEATWANLRDGSSGD